MRSKPGGSTSAVINAGVSGDTSAGGLARLDWSLEDARILRLRRSLNSAPMTDCAAFRWMRWRKISTRILARFKARGIPVLLTGMKAPRNYGEAYAKNFDAVFPQLAKKYGVLFYPFFLDGVVLNTNLLQADGLHPNPKGVEVIVKNITPMVVRLVQQAKEKHAS